MELTDLAFVKQKRGNNERKAHHFITKCHQDKQNFSRVVSLD